MSLKSQQQALATLFRRHGFHLLISPSGPIEVGTVYQGSGEGIDIVRVDELSSIVKPKNIVPTPVFTFPQVAKAIRTYDYRGIITRFTDSNIAMEFFSGLFNRIAKGLGINLSGKYSSSKIQNASYSFISNTVDSVKLNDLTRSLKNFIVDRDVWQSNKNYYVVTDIYHSKDIGLLFVEGSESDLKISLDAAKAAQIDVTRKELSGGVELIFHKDDIPLPFGIKVAELNYDYDTERITAVTTNRVFQPKGVRSRRKQYPSQKTAKRSKVLSVKTVQVGSPKNFFVKLK
jgi:hypothetical protein